MGCAGSQQTKLTPSRHRQASPKEHRPPTGSSSEDQDAQKVEDLGHDPLLQPSCTHTTPQVGVGGE